MDHISVLGFDNLLDKDSHKDLAEVHTDFLHCQESSLVKLTGPHFRDGSPSLCEVSDAKLAQFLSKLLQNRVVTCSLMLEIKDNLLAAEEPPRHFLNLLSLSESIDKSSDPGTALRITSGQEVLHQFER